jgi:hypothetical protein
MYAYNFKREKVIERELFFFTLQNKPFILIKEMEQTHENKKTGNGKKATTRASRVRWTDNAVKALLSFLLENKERVEELRYKRGATSNPENVQLWKDAETFLSAFEGLEQSYNNIQIANKWKNLVDNYKVF